MRIVWKPEEFEAAWDSARQEAAAAFGNDGMYLEKYIEEPRHLEIQIAGDDKVTRTIPMAQVRSIEYDETPPATGASNPSLVASPPAASAPSPAPRAP